MERLIISVIVALVLMIGAGVYVTHLDRQLAAETQRADEAEVRVAGLKGQLADARLKERVVVQYVDRVQVIRERGATIVKEVPVHVTKTADARCTVPVGFVRLHDSAAENRAPPVAAGDPDAPAPGIALSDVAAVVSDNYTACHATAAQLIALQDYVRSLADAEGK